LTDYRSKYTNPTDINTQARSLYNKLYIKYIVRDKFAYGTPYSFDFNKYPSNWGPKKIIQQLDTFSLGMVFTELYTNMKNEQFNMVQNNNTIPYLRYFYTLINGMIKPHYYERFTPEQALSFYRDNILPLVGGKTKNKLDKPLPLQKKNKLDKPPEIYEVIAEKMRKVCPDGKILNPKTNRCVNENGVLGRKLRKQAKSKHSNKTKKVESKKPLIKKIRIKKTKRRIVLKSIKKTNKRIVLKSIKKTKKNTNNKPKKICPSTKVLNPKTNRCVNKDGVVAKRMGL